MPENNSQKSDPSKKERQDRFLKALKISREIRLAAIEAEISECTPYEWRKEPDFRRKLEAILPPRVPTKKLQETFLKYLSESGNSSEAAKKTGVGESTPRLWYRSTPGFREAAAEAEASARNRVNQAFIEKYSKTGLRDTLAAAGISHSRPIGAGSKAIPTLSVRSSRPSQRRRNQDNIKGGGRAAVYPGL
jgi:hypothetical protein